MRSGPKQPNRRNNTLFYNTEPKEAKSFRGNINKLITNMVFTSQYTVQPFFTQDLKGVTEKKETERSLNF